MKGKTLTLYSYIFSVKGIFSRRENVSIINKDGLNNRGDSFHLRPNERDSGGNLFTREKYMISMFVNANNEISRRK